MVMILQQDLNTHDSMVYHTTLSTAKIVRNSFFVNVLLLKNKVMNS